LAAAPADWMVAEDALGDSKLCSPCLFDTRQRRLLFVEVGVSQQNFLRNSLKGALGHRSITSISNYRHFWGRVEGLISGWPSQGCAGSKAAALPKYLLGGSKIRNPGLEPRRQRTMSLDIQGLKPCCVQRPYEAVALTEEQGAVFPLQQHKASLSLDNEALAERLEIENNRAGEVGPARTGGDEPHEGERKSNTPEAKRQEKPCHRRLPHNAGENAQIDAAGTLGRLYPFLTLCANVPL
jgi:hypothetical protein